jgi:two-component system alkaline phosphatase synthesis response regulator PhoP
VRVPSNRLIGLIALRFENQVHIQVGKVHCMFTILCIDDDPRVLELQNAVLCGRGYTVLTALDGITGIALTRNYSIDALVLDFNVAGMDGNVLAQVLMKEQPNLPVVIWSGCLDDIPECLKWYADAVLDKTDGPDALVSAIETLVNRGIRTETAVARRTFTRGERLVA